MFINSVIPWQHFGVWVKKRTAEGEKRSLRIVKQKNEEVQRLEFLSSEETSTWWSTFIGWSWLKSTQTRKAFRLSNGNRRWFFHIWSIAVQWAKIVRCCRDDEHTNASAAGIVWAGMNTPLTGFFLVLAPICCLPLLSHNEEKANVRRNRRKKRKRKRTSEMRTSIYSAYSQNKLVYLLTSTIKRDIDDGQTSQ